MLGFLETAVRLVGLVVEAADLLDRLRRYIARLGEESVPATA